MGGVAFPKSFTYWGWSMNWDRKMTHWFQLPQRQVVYRLEDLARSKGQVSVELSRSDFSPNSGTGWRFFGNHQTMGISAKIADFTIKDREFINILLGCAPRHVAQLSKGLCHCCICIASCKSTAKDLTRTLTSPHHPHTQPKQRDQRNVQKACKLTRTLTSPHPDP